MAKDSSCGTSFSEDGRQDSSSSTHQKGASFISTSSIISNTVSLDAIDTLSSMDVSVEKEVVDVGDEDMDKSSATSNQLPLELEEQEGKVVDRIKRIFITHKDQKLDPIVWHSTFLAVIREMGRLHNLKRQWDWCCPHADKYVFESGLGILNDGDVELGNRQLEIFREIWSYDDPGMSDPDPKRYKRLHQSNKFVDWRDNQIICQGPESELYVRRGSVRSSDNYLSERISSQLLLYRITVLFGLPPYSEMIDGYKCCWGVELHHKDGYSMLELSERKGSAHVTFHGTTKTETEALEVLNFLCGNDISHTYGQLAGSQA